MKVKVFGAQLRLTLCNIIDCSPCPWDSPGKNPAVGGHSLLQGIFPTQGLTLGLPHCRQILYHLESQFSSVAQSCPNLCDPMDCSTSGFPVHHQIPELAQTHVHPIGDVIQPSHPLSSLTFNHSRIRVFSNESVLHIRWPKYWSFSFSISPSTEYSSLLKRVSTDCTANPNGHYDWQAKPIK